MKRNKVIGLFVVFALMATFALAGWILSIENSITGQVTSKNGEDILYFSDDFQNWDPLDTSATAQSSTKTVVINNDNGYLENFQVKITEEFQDSNMTDGCEIEPGECNISFEYDNDVIKDGDFINIESGEHNLTAKLECEVLSCPQIPSANISIS